MFYAHLILAKKGPLARIWLAAHWDKKITKAHVFETNIEKSVEGIMQPKVKLALRTSGHLLLGVVRIYSRKAKYLLADCNEAFVKIKMAFRPGMVDLPEGHREANVNAITLPEVFHDFDTALPELNDIDIEAQFAINQSRADEITMREDYGGSLSLSIHDDGFGDMGFEGDTPDLIRGPIDANIDDKLFGDDGMADVTLVDEPKITLNDSDLANSRLDGDGFGDEFGQPELFEDDLFAEPQPPLDANDNNDLKAVVGAGQASDDDDDDDDGMDHMDVRPPSVASSCEHALEANEAEKEVQNKEEAGNEAMDNVKEDENPLDQSTLLQNEDESFALAPIDASAYKGVTKTKRKRKLIVDEVKNISGEEMKAQLANTSDIVTTLDLAPPTKRLTYWKETGGVEKLFSLPSRTIPARMLFMNYHRHLTSHSTSLEDFSMLGPADVLAIEHIQNENDANAINNNKRGRKRKHEIQVVQQIVAAADITTQSLAAPEAVREHEQSTGQNQFSLADNLIPNVAESSLFDNMRSPSAMLSINDIQGLDNLTGLHDLPPLTPGNLGQPGGLDASDDFNHDDAAPLGLHHDGDHTPHHSGIENIESLPNLPADQVSSILQEAENMPPNIQQQDEGQQEPNKTQQRTSDISTDWNDYDLPPLPPNPADEQLENETDEQFEERVLNKRAAQLFYTVKSRFIKQDSLLLSALTANNSRKQAAQKFYSLLVLKKFRALNIEQTQPYTDIEITRGPLFDNPKL